MKIDFTPDKYLKFCDALKANYEILRVRDYLAKKEFYIGKPIVILRHDVDRRPNRALALAEIEHQKGIRSTYYFRKISGIFVPDTIEHIEKMGHEIGYHYEVLDKADGNHNKALKIFSQELEDMRKIADIKTVCMHGSPLKPWKNQEIWNIAKLEEYGLLGEPYLSIDYSQVSYYTDTGRRWNGEKYSVDDQVEQSKKETARSTDDLIDIIRKKYNLQMLINLHPHRWLSGGAWVKELIGQNVKNVGKKFLKRRKQ